MKQDNLIALEMKKVIRENSKQQQEINKDKERIIALTRSSYNDDWQYDGQDLPDYVCRFILGIYYEIDYVNRQICNQYYRSGELVHEIFIDFAEIGL